ncbi:hypothetical protein NDU88_003651 [Pleurodeles waltl]|uniref:Myb/SANT-like DNA-binding domain-containing protein n=1 Tax=Pleurodeles waltl TaxID=8319 RepID=A0AAV7RFW1_PLEWA|nr:hypothetical protein NDU88_003651 [Pleurodeles waltl]
MARVTGERTPAFTGVEVEKLVDRVLPQYRMLYGPPDQKVSAYQKKSIWRAIAKEMRTLGVYGRWSTHCCKRWEDLRHRARNSAEAQLGMASQRGRGARRTRTPLMFRILAVAYKELDGHLRASQQPLGVLHIGLIRTQARTSDTKCTATVVLAASAGGRGFREPAITTYNVPAPAAKGKDKEAPTAVKGKEAPPAVKGKEAPLAAKVMDKEPPQAGKGKGPAPAGRKFRRPGAGTESEPPTPTMAVQPSKAEGEGLEPPPTTGILDTSTATSISARSSGSSPSGQPSEAAGMGLSLLSPLPAPPAAPVGSRPRLQGTGRRPPTIASTTSSPSEQPSEAAGEGQEPPPTTASTASSPSGQLSMAAGDRQEPPLTTGIPDTSPATATTEQPSPAVCRPASMDCSASWSMYILWV